MRLWIQRFLAHLRAGRNFSEHTLRAYRGDLAEFERLWSGQGGGEPSQWTRRRARSVIESLQAGPIGRSSLLRKIAALRSFVRYLVDEDALSRDPFAGLPMPRRASRLPRFLSERETGALMDGGAPGGRLLDLRDRAILELLYSSGLRRSELARLNAADVDFISGALRVFGKGGRERMVPAGHAALSALRKYLEARPASTLALSRPLFLNARGGRLSPDAVALVVKRSARRAGLLKGVTPHGLRHSFATQMLDRGCDVRTLQEMLGHKSLAATQVYTHASLDMIRRVYRKSHPRSKKP
ncbi:MAG: tyrosine-type recombinase/integrase [Elusimicrobia bacterium]|nr:tyrosine-type recombinase/integrase [Elusimicrobiota bacterium]